MNNYDHHFPALAPSRRLYLPPGAGSLDMTPTNDTTDTQNNINTKSVLCLGALCVLLCLLSGIRIWWESPRNRRRLVAQQHHRKKFIESALLIKTVIKSPDSGDPNDDEDVEDPSLQPHQTNASEKGDKLTNMNGADGKPNYMRQKTNIVLPPESSNVNSLREDEANDLTCPICLGDFQEGDKVCFSYNPECNHAFHIECIETWLMKHSRCPLCRAKYLIKKPSAAKFAAPSTPTIRPPRALLRAVRAHMFTFRQGRNEDGENSEVHEGAHEATSSSDLPDENSSDIENPEITEPTPEEDPCDESLPTMNDDDIQAAVPIPTAEDTA